MDCSGSQAANGEDSVRGRNHGDEEVESLSSQYDVTCPGRFLRKEQGYKYSHDRFSLRSQFALRGTVLRGSDVLCLKTIRDPCTGMVL